MAFRYKLTHHPAADFQRAKDYFAEIDGDLADFSKLTFVQHYEASRQDD